MPNGPYINFGVWACWGLTIFCLDLGDYSIFMYTAEDNPIVIPDDDRTKTKHKKEETTPTTPRDSAWWGYIYCGIHVLRSLTLLSSAPSTSGTDWAAITGFLYVKI